MVLGVAAAAFARAGFRHTPVVTGPGADVFGYVLMTSEAQRGLTLSVGPIMAVAAIAFDPGMRL
jgi:hypothetical protein